MTAGLVSAKESVRTREQGAAETGDADRLAALADRYWEFQKAEQPFGPYIAGQLDSDTPILFRESPADYARRHAAAAVMLGELATIDRDALTPGDRATHGLLARELGDMRAFYAVGAHLRPFLLPVGPDFNTVFYANATNVVDARSARLHADRLAAFPAFLADVLACLEKGRALGIRFPRVVLKASAAATRGIASAAPEASPWYAPYLRSAAAGQPAVAREAARALATIAETLIPALTAHADYLEGPLLAEARDTVSAADAPGGAEYYALLVAHFTNGEQSPEAIHEFGLAEVARIGAEMAAVAAEAGYPNDVEGYRHFLNTDPQFVAPDAETLREQVEVLCKRIDARIPEFFRRIPRITYGVGVVPAGASASLPSAYAMPASPGGTSAGMLFLNGMPEKCPSYLHPAIAMHEAWPGHLMHVGMMAELDELPAFRRFGATRYTACVEGWALYCEQLGHEFGVYRTPHHHYGRLEMEMWRACRLVVDTGLHARGWSRDEATAYMKARLALSHATITAEVDRYIAMPAQALAYQIGGRKLRELRARSEAALGDDFSLRDFHEVVMTAGGVTLPLLDELVDAWIAARRQAA